MPVGCADFDSWDNEEILGQRPVAQVVVRLAGVVICDGDALQTLCDCRGNKVFRRACRILGKEGMHMQIKSAIHDDDHFPLRQGWCKA